MQRYASLKLTKTYNTLRLLFLTENKLFMHFKELHNHKKTTRKGSSQNRGQGKRKNKYLVSEKGEDSKEEGPHDSGYPTEEVAA